MVFGTYDLPTLSINQIGDKKICVLKQVKGEQFFMQVLDQWSSNFHDH